LHDLGRAPGAERPAGPYARQILSRLLVDLSWASSRLEGNTGRIAVRPARPSFILDDETRDAIRYRR
jgi:hypothetical protein